MLQPPVPNPPRSWSSLALSAAVHAALIVLAVALSRRPAEPSTSGATEPSDQRHVDMVYLEPPPASKPPPPPAPEPPPEPPPPKPQPSPERRTPPAVAPPEREQATPEPNANAPPDAVRTEGPDGEEAEGGGAADAERREAVTMESEARRIFGRPRVATAPGVGTRAVRPMEAYLPEDPTKCVPRPAAARDSSRPVEFGVAEGRILRGDNGRPLAGAHLQMLGTPYTAFTDEAGDYEFRFDLSLVDQCRTQYVRVTAKGYESRLLVLMIGANVRSEDVRLEKRSWFP